MDFDGKGKTTEGKGLTGYSLAKRFSLASPSMLLPSKPLPPIPKSSTSPKASKMFHGEQETGKPGTGLDQEIRQKQLTLERKGTKDSLPYASGGEMKKGSLGLPLIPPIRKAGSLPVPSAAGSVCSSPQLDLQESWEMRSGPSSRNQEKTSEHAGLTGYSLAKRFSLASPSMLLPSKPLPPILKRSPFAKASKMWQGEEKTGKTGTSCDEESRKEEELTLERKGSKTSLRYPSDWEKKKGAFGKSFIPVMRKAGGPLVGIATGSLCSSPQMDLQESREMRSGSSSRGHEKSSEHAGLTYYCISNNLPQTRPSSLLPSKPLPPIRESSSSIKPSIMFDGEKETEKNSSGSNDIRRSSQEQTSERKALKTSLCYSSGWEKKKGAFGKPFIPVMRKAGGPLVGIATGSLCSSPQMDLQECQEMRPKSCSRSQEKSSEHAASSDTTTKTQRKEEKSSQCKPGPGMPLFPRELTDSFGLEMPVLDLGHGNGGLGSRPAQGALAQGPQEHGLGSHRGLTGYPLAKRFSLYVSDVPVPRKSLSPLQKSCLSLKIRKRLPTDQSVFEE